jgi:hypothetical protein
MREIEVVADREWLVIVTRRHRAGREPKVSRMYLSVSEAALAVELLKRHLPEVSVSKPDAE